MSEHLTKRVASFMRNEPSRRGGRTRAVVIALREEIQKALDDGWSVMAIWKTLHADGSVQVGYHVFRRHVAKLLPRASSGERMSRAATTAETPPAHAADRPRVFQHSRVPQKKEIYG